VPDCHQLGYHPSTACNELKCNTGQRGYRAKQAHGKTIRRRKEKMSTRITALTWARVNILTRQEFSPEQICGRLALEEYQTVSHESIYQNIYADKSHDIDLHGFLRFQKERKKTLREP